MVSQNNSVVDKISEELKEMRKKARKTMGIVLALATLLTCLMVQGTDVNCPADSRSRQYTYTGGGNQE